MEKAETENSPPRWKRRLKIGVASSFGGIAALVLVFQAYYWIADLFYKPKPETVKSQRPDLGSITLTPTVTEDGISGWVAEFNLDTSVEEVWRIFRSCHNMAAALKSVYWCKNLEKGDGWEINYFKLNRPSWYLKHKTWYYPKQYSSRWKMLEGSFTAAAGHFRVNRSPGHPGWSRVSYGYFVNINPLLPKKFERDKNKHAVRHMALEIQKYIADVRAGVKRPATM